MSLCGQEVVEEVRDSLWKEEEIHLLLYKAAVQIPWKKLE